MLAKQERLTRNEFEHFFRVGRRYHGPYFQVVYSPHERFHGAVVVGKKVFKKAVRRNRLRRQVYGVLYRTKVRESLSGVYIIIAKPTAGTLSQRQIPAEVESVLAQVQTGSFDNSSLYR